MLRWVLRLFGVLIVLALVALGGVFLIPAERIAQVAVQKFNDLTGRELRIEGSVRPSIWPVLGVRAEGISVSNTDWSDQGPMLSAKALDISLDLPALINGEVKVTKITALGPKIILERAADGRENWVFGGPNGGAVTQATPGVGAGFSLLDAAVQDGSLTFVDHASGARVHLEAITASASLPDFAGPFHLKMSARMNGQDFALRADLARFQDALDGKSVGVVADLTVGASGVKFDGQAGLAPEAKGQIDADIADLSALTRLAGVAAPALPQGLGAGGIGLTGEVTATAAGTLHLRAGKLRLDNNALALDADLTQGEARPKVVARVSAGALDLSALAGGAGQGGGSAGDGWSRATLDFSGLGAVDADVSLDAEAIDLGLIRLAPASLRAGLDRARLSVDLGRVGAYGGSIGGNFVVNGRKGQSLGGDLRFSGMDLQGLLRDFAGVERLLGTGDLAVKFLASGQSMAAIMSSLEGSGQLVLGRGEILGLDIQGMISSLDPGYVGEGKSTVYDDMSASFVIAGGDLTTQDLVLNSALLKVDGAGRIGIGGRDIDLRLKALGLREADGTGGVALPILVRGPWSGPAITPDLEALMQERLDLEKAKLEAELQKQADAARAEAEAKLKAELEKATGGTVQPGESLEDAANRLGQEALEKQGQDLLNNLLSPP